MDLANLRAAEYRLTHRHADGTWVELVEASPAHHGVVEHDPERAWGSRRLFRCPSCEEEVSIVPADADGDPIQPQ